jgi:hypothetical protein
MNKRWWEGPVIIIADFWYIWVILLVLILTAYFTRSYWFPALGL